MPALLSLSNETNWLTDEAPQMLLDKSLSELFLFVKDYQKAGLWEGRYKEKLAAFAGQDMGKVMDRAAKRDSV
jgi:hypothetical protein